VSDQFDQAFWDERYRSQAALWSGNPNRHLVAEVEDLTPATALEVAAGEGADAIWLARRGWHVTAVEISSVALERAAGHAAEAGSAIAERIQWLHQDVLDWDPPRERYDLVSSQYLHLPTELRRALFDRLASAVAPGGTLLIVGHHPSDLVTVPRPQPPELFFTGDDIARDLDATQWDVVTNTAAERTGSHDGRTVVLHDAVLRARRQPRHP
jgi:SAM-dependent methyltransferase